MAWKTTKGGALAHSSTSGTPACGTAPFFCGYTERAFRWLLLLLFNRVAEILASKCAHLADLKSP